MADMMNRGTPPGVNKNLIDKNLSVANPTDLNYMKQSGMFNPDMTVIEFLNKLGVDENGPVTQLTKLGMQQTQNATALGKMQNISKEMNPPPGGTPPVTGAPPSGSGMNTPPAGLEGLLKNIK